MTALGRSVAVAAVALLVGVVTAGCGSIVGGSAVASSTVATFRPSAPAQVTVTSSVGAPSAAGRAAPGSSAPGRSSAVPIATASPGPPPTAVRDSATWSAVVETGVGSGIPSPNGDLRAEFVGDQVCFVPLTGEQRCEPLTTGATPTFAVFSQDGNQFLVVAGPAAAAGVYVFDAVDGTARVLGPQGVADFSAGSTAPGWELSSVVWGADGNSVLLVPRTAGVTGPVLQFDLTSRSVAERIRMDAVLANSSPSLWTTATGMAVVANVGDERNALWWFDFATGSANRIAVLPESGGTIALISADPQGRFVLICPRRADGALGAITAVAVDHSESVRLLPDSLSCAGSVSSTDGRYLAVTAELDGAYSLVVVDVAGSRRVLTTALPVPAPSAPPYLTWNGDVIVAADVTGEWPVPSVVVRLTR